MAGLWNTSSGVPTCSIRPLVHHDDAVGDFERFFLIVRDQNARDVNFVVQPAQPGPQALADLRIESAERFVEQQHLRLDRQRPGERHALPLAAGKLRRETACRGRRAAPARAVRVRVSRSLRSLGRSFARPHAQAERDVLEHAHVAEQRVVLEHEADVPLGDRAVGDVLVVEANARASVVGRAYRVRR